MHGEGEGATWNLDGSVCFKCKASRGVVCSRDGPIRPYCADCFVEFCTRLVRESLFKHCAMPSEEPLIVAVSGGHSSMALLHQLGVLRMQNRLRPKGGHVAFSLIPLHLREDELVVPPITHETCGNDGSNDVTALIRRVAATMTEQFERLEVMIRTQCVTWEFASFPLFTEDEVCVVRYSDYLSSDALQAARSVMHHSRLSLSDREHLNACLRRRVLAVAAADHINRWKRARGLGTPWHHILTGENALRCCMTALRETMCGAGENTPHLCGYRGLVNQCLVLRPLRTFLPRELVLYCRLQSIWGGYSPSLSTCTSLRSINRTLEVFFNRMMRSYRTSVFNVLNTVEKLDAGAWEPGLKDADMQAAVVVVGQRQAKRIIPGKTAQFHYECLQTRKPPRHSWLDAGVKLAMIQEDNHNSPQLCLVCGCVFSAADVHPVVLDARRMFLCDACLRFLEALPDDIVSVTLPPVSTGGDVLEQVKTVLHNGLLGVFSTLAQQMESLMQAADALGGQ